MVRRHAVLTGAVLTGLLTASALTACSTTPAITSDRTDLDAAVAAWTDRWVAPTSAMVAGPALGSNGQVSRVVARRTTDYAADVERATRSELRLALAAGWAPTSSTCGDTVQVALVGPDEDALAQLVVTPDGDGAAAAVQVVTPHHLDATWPTPEPIARTCLDTTSPPFEPPPLQSGPLGDADAVDDGPAGWDDDASSSTLVDAVNADPALSALGLEVATSSLAAGVNRRRPPAGEGSAPPATLGALATELDGWVLTFAACGGRGPTLATFVRSFEGSPAVVTASLAPDGTGLRVTLPVAEGPDPAWLADPAPLADPTCLGDTAALPRRSHGVPAVLPTDLTPITTGG